MVRRARKIQDSTLHVLLDRGLTQTEIRQELLAMGIEVTKQAISVRVRQLRPPAADKLLPWSVRRVHSVHGWMYDAVVSYAKWRRGDGGLNATRVKAARHLEEALNSVGEHGAVLFYDPQRGFVMRARRPTDGPDVLVKH